MTVLNQLKILNAEKAYALALETVIMKVPVKLYNFSRMSSLDNDKYRQISKNLLKNPVENFFTATHVLSIPEQV